MRMSVGPGSSNIFKACLVFLLVAGTTNISGASFSLAGPGVADASQLSLLTLTDAWIAEGYPTSACGKEAYLAAGYDLISASPGRLRSFLKFDLTNLPAGVIVTQASLNLFYLDHTGPTTGVFPISVERVAGPWAENSIQWGTSPPIISGDPITTTVNHTWFETWITLDITWLVQGWLQGQFPNYGIALLGPEEISAKSASEIFASSESENKPYITITYTSSPTAALQAANALNWHAYLPLLAANFPPLLDLHPIDNDGGEGNYTITWSPYPKTVDGYELYEWNGVGWTLVYQAPANATSWWVTNKPLGTYTYQLKTYGAWGSETSLVRSVTVSDQPNPFVYLVIGVGDYQEMPSIYSPDSQLGNDLKYPIFDATDVQDMLEVYGYVEGQPTERVLALKNRQATKDAIREAITGWIDARETTSTTIFIYYAGHTLLAGEPPKPYLAPYDLACSPCGDSPTWLAASGISADELNAWLGELAARRILFVFDSAESARWIDELGVPGRQILAGSSSSSPGEKRWEFDEIKNGAFSWFFNDSYTQTLSTDSVSLYDAYNYTKGVNVFVNNQTQSVPGGPFMQKPAFYGDLEFPQEFIKAAGTAACKTLVMK